MPEPNYIWKSLFAATSKLIGATISEIWRIRCFYTNDAKKDTTIDDDEKFQLISVKTLTCIWVYHTIIVCVSFPPCAYIFP